MLRGFASTLLGFCAVALLAHSAAFAEEKAKDEKKEERGGKVVGVVTAKGDNFIEVKADGEEKARRYVPHWKGGNPAQGGGPDKEMVAKIKEVPLKSRVEIEWKFEERPRVEKITILKRGDGKEVEKPKGNEKKE